MIGPPLHHLSTFLHVQGAVVGGTDLVALDMGKLTLDGIGMPESGLVEDGGCRGPESMGGGP